MLTTMPALPNDAPRTGAALLHDRDACAELLQVECRTYAGNPCADDDAVEARLRLLLHR